MTTSEHTAETETDEQFPSVSGDVEAEVEKRSADGADGLLRRKTFVIQGARFDDPEHPAHAPNKAFVLEEAIQNGLHPKAEPELDDAFVQDTNRRGVETWEVTYTVEVTPAAIDTDNQATTVTAHDFIEARGGSTEGDPGEALSAQEADVPRPRAQTSGS